MLKAFAVFLLLAGTVALAEEPAVTVEKKVEKGKNHFETEFVPGGRLQLEVRSGAVRISGTDRDLISIHYEGRNDEDISDVVVHCRKTANNARLEVSGNGLVAAYIHTGAKVGVLVEVVCGKAGTVSSDEFKQLVKDITLQIAAGSPQVVSRESIAPAVIAKEREIAAQSDRLKNKPAAAMEKILAGVLEKFYQTYCLVDQGFVKRNSEVSVKEHVAQISKQLGDEVSIRRFIRFQVGESQA